MEKDTEKTPVIFRIYRGEVCAYFPAEPYDISGALITCYAHVGQHGAADISFLSKGRLATAFEYADLRDELEDFFGYNLEIYKKRTRKHDASRAAQIEEWRRLK